MAAHVKRDDPVAIAEPGQLAPEVRRGLGPAWDHHQRPTRSGLLVVQPDPIAGRAREHGYCRALVPPSDIQMLDGSAVPDQGEIWIYVQAPESDHPPDARFPIVQSYVDLFLSGCIELARRVVMEDLDFLAACVSTTQGWSAHWVNARIYPRRPVHQPDAARIDGLLHHMLPVQFAAIRIE